MDEYESRRAEEAHLFVANKIKRCRKCRNELHYKEKFYNADKICNRCRGLPEYS